jgi:hypothetical protein
VSRIIFNRAEPESHLPLPDRKKSAMPARFFLDLAESFRFRVWIPSFFIVIGLSTCDKKGQ